MVLSLHGKKAESFFKERIKMVKRISIEEEGSFPSSKNPNGISLFFLCAIMAASNGSISGLFFIPWEISLGKIPTGFVLVSFQLWTQVQRALFVSQARLSHIQVSTMLPSGQDSR